MCILNVLVVWLVENKLFVLVRRGLLRGLLILDSGLWGVCMLFIKEVGWVVEGCWEVGGLLMYSWLCLVGIVVWLEKKLVLKFRG